MIIVVSNYNRWVSRGAKLLPLTLAMRGISDQNGTIKYVIYLVMLRQTDAPGCAPIRDVSHRPIVWTSMWGLLEASPITRDVGD